MKRKLLIDGDIVVYRFACRSECAVQWTPGEVSAVGDIDQARREATTWINDLVERLKADSYTLVFGDDEHRSFRFDLFPDYKAHRTQGRPPVHRKEVENMLRTEFPSESRPGLEADDVMGIMATMKTALKLNEERVIVTIDKDLETVPGAHFNYRKDKDVRQVSVEQADYNHLFLTLVGDTADGFKGCPGIGPKKAAHILNTDGGDIIIREVPASAWPRVVRAFKAKGLTEDHALLQARLARVLRASDFDFLERKPILWTPPTI